MINQLTPSTLQSIIQSGEGYNAEFKIRVPNKLKELSEEICAFANAAGGILLIGVSDDNVIHGVEIDNGKRSAIQNSLNEINPHIPTTLYPVEVENKSVWVIEVNSGPQKPYVLSGAIYVRQGPNTQKLTTVEQMRDFFQQSDRIYFDEAPCQHFDPLNDMDDNWFEEFRVQSGLSKTIPQEQIIQNLKIVLPEGSMKNGGVLFFGSAPKQFIETAVIRCIAFEGLNKTQIIDDKVYGGPLMKQYEQAMQWLKGKLDVRYDIEGSGPRKEIWEIPETAFKETIINALSHRGYYDRGAKIIIEFFEDRVEISNPGGLTSAISLSLISEPKVTAETL
jgi:ATP-dependent DNA helicase RecG